MTEGRSPLGEMEDPITPDRNAEGEMRWGTRSRQTIVQGDALSGPVLHYYGSAAKER